MKRNHLITINAEEANQHLNFIKDAVYRLLENYGSTKYKFVRSAHTGNYLIADCYILDNNHQIAKGFETPVPIRHSEIDDIIFDK